MNKSLAPLIVFLALIILATIVITNSSLLNTEAFVEYDQNELMPDMKLSPFARARKQRPRKLIPAKNTGPKPLYYPNSKNLFAQVRSSLVKGDEKTAEERLRTLLVFDPYNFEGLSMLGDIFYRSQRYKEAELIFRRQLELNSQSSVAYNNLGSALAKQHKFKEAIKHAEKALEIEPGSATVYLNLSGMYSVTGQKKSSIEYFQKAYEKIGERILPLINDPTLDNIRSDPEFKAILKDAGKKSKKMKPEANLKDFGPQGKL